MTTQLTVPPTDKDKRGEFKSGCQQAPSVPVAAAFKALRPPNGSKTFVFAALIFSLNFDDGEMWVRTIGAFFAFCFVSSTGYIFNDLRDREADRLHPKK